MEINRLLSNIGKNDLILTPNRRLAQFLQRRYDQIHQQKGYLVWPSITVLPVSTWIDQTWERLTKDARLVLNDFQEHILWEQVIADTNKVDSIINLNATAKIVKDTWQLLNHWQLDLRDLAQYPNPDINAFIEFVTNFKSSCERMNCISRSELLPLLVNYFSAIASCVLDDIYFVGFDDFFPLLRTFMHSLARFTSVTTIQLGCFENSQVTRTSFLEQELEIIAMARWAFGHLAANNNVQIGCVIPNLAEKRNQVMRIFNDVFYAEGFKNSTLSPSCYNISAANCLAHFSIIKIALQILTIDLHEVALEEISQLLLSPFIQGAEIELSVRATLDSRLRANAEKMIQLDYLAKHPQLTTCPIFLTLLQHKIQLLQTRPQQATLYYWATLFTQQLISMGWPGERSLTSEEYQLVERFKKIFDELITLDAIHNEISYATALDLLRKLVNKSLFQPKSDPAPIQLLGILEAAGIAFDHLWVSGLDNETWPAPSAPNPFIPFPVQKKYQMPHATAERELQFSIRLMQGFLSNAKQIIFSHAEIQGEKPLAPSALILTYPYRELELPAYQTIETKIFETKKITHYIDKQGPTLDDVNISGGSAIFKAQAACPFQAFAKFRLGAEPLATSQLGLAASERGSLLHTVLAYLFAKLKTHETLCHLSSHELDTLIEAQIDQALSQMQARKPFSLKSTLYLLEKKRLTKLIHHWLTIEKNRQTFEVIACEQKIAAKIGPLHIQVQLDRLDRLGDGSYLIIDYKTGRTNIMDWFSDRPNEPQLPLYSMLFEQTLSGVLFAQVKTGDSTFKGIVLHDDNVPGAITLAQLTELGFTTVQELTEYWQKNLVELANNFCNGDANVDPKDHHTCQYCQLQSLCRIKEMI